MLFYLASFLPRHALAELQCILSTSKLNLIRDGRDAFSRFLNLLDKVGVLLTNLQRVFFFFFFHRLQLELLQADLYTMERRSRKDVALSAGVDPKANFLQEKYN